MGNVNNLMMHNKPSYVVFDKIEQLRNKNVKLAIDKQEKINSKIDNKSNNNHIVQVSQKRDNEWQEYEITQYVATGNRTSSGRYPQGGRTVASNFLPQGTTIYIDGLGERTVEDKGASWSLRSNVIDVYIDGSRQDALNFGRQTRKVKIIKLGDE